MKRIFTIFLAAVAGSACGAGVRQLVEFRRKEPDERGELVIAASPAGIGAGVLAGLLFRSHGPAVGPAVAFIAAANVGANVDSERMAALVERLRAGHSAASGTVGVIWFSRLL